MAAFDRRALDRRRLLQGSAGLGLLGLGGCATGQGLSAARGASQGPRTPIVRLAPLRISPDRVFDITVCLRPFRAAGPRLDVEQVGDATVVHNYGHGGSGWSLSWGSSAMAVRKAMASSPAQIAVLGCGALGLTSAILAQRAGAQVTIYAKEFLPRTRSARATGSWTPDSRIALASAAGPGFAAVWEQMARTSFKTYRDYLGLPGDPVQWIDHYSAVDARPDLAPTPGDPPGGLDFAHYRHLIADLTPKPELLPPEIAPFRDAVVYRSESMQFNIADYGHTLISDFLAAGGRLQHMEFHAPSDLAGLREKVVINCPGYGARALWRDASIVPVRGQIAWLIPQAEVNYGADYRDVLMRSRTDGIVIQSFEGGDMRGYGDANEAPDRAEADHAVAVMAELYSKLRPPA